MANHISDQAFELAVSQTGLVAPEHIEAAKVAQAKAAKQGVTIALADIMVLKHVLTPAIRENIEKKILAQELQNLPEQLKSFVSYAELYEQLGNYSTARNFYERAIAIAHTIEDTKRELVLKDRLTKMLKKQN